MEFLFVLASPGLMCPVPPLRTETIGSTGDRLMDVCVGPH